MLRRLSPGKGQTPEQARKALDGMLEVSGWASPGHEPRRSPRDPGTPWWWESPEEASDSFLKSMGVVL